MKKIRTLARYEMLNLKRGKLIWIIAVLYAVGVQQCLSSMLWGGSTLFSLVGLIKVSWLPLNFIMIPVLLLGMEIGLSEDDIFKTLDITKMELFLGKIVTLAVVDSIILLLNFTLALIIGIIKNISAGYFLYQMVGYITNTVVFLVVCTSIGLFIGQVLNKRIGDVLSFMSTILIAIILSNFYKTFNYIVPLINIRTVSNNFDVISYDKSYILHNELWLLIAFMLLFVAYFSQFEKQEKIKARRFFSVVLTSLVSICVFLIIAITLMRPTLYYVGKRWYDSKENKYSIEKNESFISEDDCGYYVSRYNMKINLNNHIQNDCQMEILVKGDKIRTVELGLYKQLNISSVEIGGESIKYKRTNNSFIVVLPRDFTKGESIKLRINYSGTINTIWNQGRQLFVVRDNVIFLAGFLEWYPKLNDLSTKEFSVNIKYQGMNKLYSNLNETTNSYGYSLRGTSKEIFLISGKLSERTYKGYLFAGNEEYVNSNKECDAIIDMLRRSSLSDIQKIMFVPLIPGSTENNYNNTFLLERD